MGDVRALPVHLSVRPPRPTHVPSARRGETSGRALVALGLLVALLLLLPFLLATSPLGGAGLAPAKGSGVARATVLSGATSVPEPSTAPTASSVPLPSGAQRGSDARASAAISVPHPGAALSTPCTLQGLPSSLTGTFNTSLPPAGISPSACTLNYSLAVLAPSGALTISGANGITVASTVGNSSLWMDISGSVLIGSNSFLTVSPGTSLRLAVQGTLTILAGGNLSLSNTSTLVLGVGARLILAGGMFYTHGAPVLSSGGLVSMSSGATVDGSLQGPPSGPASHHLAHLNIQGSLTSFNDTGSDVHWLNVSDPGNVGDLDLQGFSSAQPMIVQNLTVQQNVTSLFADDATLAGVACTSARSVELGVPQATSDTVHVNGLTVGKPVPTLEISHAAVSSLGISSAAVIAVENSTFGPGAASVTAASSYEFTANQSSHFGFTMVFYNPPFVNLTNTSAPAIAVLGSANVSVYNWGFPTTLLGGSSAALPSITTSAPGVEVHVSRYLLISVSPVGPNTVASKYVNVTLCSQSAGGSCEVLAVDPQGTVGRFVPTDVVALNGVDSFVGVYTISAVSSTGYSSPDTTVSVVSSGMTVHLTMTIAPVPPQLIPVFLLEVSGIGVVVGGIVLLRTRVRRLERLRKTRTRAPSTEGGNDKPPRSGKEGEGSDPGEPPQEAAPRRTFRRPPAKEWRPPAQKSAGPKAGSVPPPEKGAK